MKPFYPDLQQHSPSRRPDWRWQRAQRLLDAGRYFSRRRDDEQTGRAIHYLRSLQKSGGKLRAGDLAQFRDVLLAHELHQSRGNGALIMQARLLARQTTAAISVLTGVPPAVVDAYESLFFNVRDRFDARDWIMAECILGGRPARPLRESVFLRFAYGPFILEAVRPYLIDGVDLFAEPLDLSTAAGRQEQVIRLSLALELLPMSPENDHALQKMLPLIHEIERNRRLKPAPTVVGDRLFAERIQEIGLNFAPTPDNAPSVSTPAAGFALTA